MREENFGPVMNADGTPTAFTIQWMHEVGNHEHCVHPAPAPEREIDYDTRPQEAEAYGDTSCGDCSRTSHHTLAECKAQQEQDKAQEQEQGWPVCPVCADGIDYCQGHGEVGDPRGFEVLKAHNDGDHEDCHPFGCLDKSKVYAQEGHAKDDHYWCSPDDCATAKAEADYNAHACCNRAREALATNECGCPEDCHKDMMACVQCWWDTHTEWPPMGPVNNYIWPLRRVAGLGPVVNERYDATQSYRLNCGHTAAAF